MSTLNARRNSLKIVEKRNNRIALSHNRTNQLLQRSEALGLVETYIDHKGRVRTKKEK